MFTACTGSTHQKRIVRSLMNSVMAFIHLLHRDLWWLPWWSELNPLRVATLPAPMVLNTVCVIPCLLSLLALQANWLIFEAKVSCTGRQPVHVGVEFCVLWRQRGGSREDVPLLNCPDSYHFWAERVMAAFASSVPPGETHGCQLLSLAAAGGLWWWWFHRFIEISISLW